MEESTNARLVLGLGDMVGHGILVDTSRTELKADT